MIPDFETVEHLAKRARAERALYVAELIATALVAVDGFMGRSWVRAAAFVRSLTALTRQAVIARR